MRHPLLLILLFLFTPLFAEDGNSFLLNLPSDAMSALTAYDKELAQLKANYDSEILKRANVLRARLEAAQVASTKAGNLDAALACKAAIAKVGSETGMKVPMASKASADAISGNVITPAQADALVARLSTMSTQEWEALPGVEVRASAGSLTPTPVTVADGETFLMLPCPTDKWMGFNYQGNPAQKNWTGLKANGGALVWTTDSGRTNGSGEHIIKGIGRVSLYCNFGSVSGRTGEIRVKFFKVK